MISRQRLFNCIDNTTNSGDTDRVDHDYSQASILVVFINDEEKQTSSILITQRKKNLRKHAGQVAFPGGRKEDSDKNLMDTVIRETEEEINLSKDNYDIIGNLPNFYTGTGYVVTPFIALMKSKSNWENVIYSNPEEVEKIFIPEATLLLSPEFHIREKPPIGSSMLMTWRINYNNENIWGLTARVLVTISAGLGLREFPPCDDI